jgi:hypothetical protein
VNYAKVVANLAHELGHLWGLGHCDAADPECGIMCLSLGGCNGSLTDFGATMTAQLSNFIKSAGCLSTIPQPLSPPVVDPFAKSTFDAGRWAATTGAAINSSALLEPSGTLSANLDSADEIRTNKIALGGQSAIDVGWFVECRGASSGETLQIEYLDELSQWSTLAQWTSDGSSWPGFVYKRSSLPANALHDEFQLRFRALGNGDTDDWFVDQVGIDVAPPPASRFATSGILPVVFEFMQGGQSPGGQQCRLRSAATRLFHCRGRHR